MNDAEAAFIPCYHINEEGGITDWKNLYPLSHAFMKSSFSNAYEHALRTSTRDLASEVHDAVMERFVHIIRGNDARCSFDIQVNKPVGIEAMKQADIALYPNPSEGKFFFQSSQQIIYRIEVKDLRGRVLLDQQVAQTKGIIDLSGFQDGMYVVSLMMKNKTVDVKVQKNE